MAETGSVRFAVIGVNHYHIFGQVNCLLDAGAELVAVDLAGGEPHIVKQFQQDYPQARVVPERAEILEDESIQLVVGAAIPFERAAIGIEVMRHGKDYMSDKGGFTTLDQLAEVRTVQKETGRIYSICFSERFENRATVKAAELVRGGAIGRVIQTVGLGPHALHNQPRPDWFFRKLESGGILADIASHQVDQFLYFTGSAKGEVVSSQVANHNNPDHPEFEDFGEIVLNGNGATGYIRVDWFTPDGLGVWGDGRLFVLGTEGYIELRKYIDIDGKPNPNHLFLVDKKGIRHIDCNDVPLPYGRQLIDDVLNRTETAMGQEHCFEASRLCLEAELRANRLGNLAS
ncbi:MAG: Gfo/Idh/MocA family oxidoreductase [Rhodospirillales bacterium]|nr:Gfo/Idh/MocA family oxidoreductase [Rhodospirillales bacterium]